MRVDTPRHPIPAFALHEDRSVHAMVITGRFNQADVLIRCTFSFKLINY